MVVGTFATSTLGFFHVLKHWRTQTGGPPLRGGKPYVLKCAFPFHVSCVLCMECKHCRNTCCCRGRRSSNMPYPESEPLSWLVQYDTSYRHRFWSQFRVSLQEFCYFQYARDETYQQIFIYVKHSFSYWAVNPHTLNKCCIYIPLIIQLELVEKKLEEKMQRICKSNT